MTINNDNLHHNYSCYHTSPASNMTSSSGSCCSNKISPSIAALSIYANTSGSKGMVQSSWVSIMTSYLSFHPRLVYPSSSGPLSLIARHNTFWIFETYFGYSYPMCHLSRSSTLSLQVYLLLTFTCKLIKTPISKIVKCNLGTWNITLIIYFVSNSETYLCIFSLVPWPLVFSLTKYFSL